MARQRMLRVHPAWLFLLVGPLLNGCGGGGVLPPDPADPQVARQLLTDALSAWKSGKSTTELKQGEPAIYVADEEWATGSKLHAFEIATEGTLMGTSVRFDVHLQVAGPKASSAQRKLAVYAIATTPAVSIVRDDS